MAETTVPVVAGKELLGPLLVPLVLQQALRVLVVLLVAALVPVLGWLRY